MTSPPRPEAADAPNLPQRFEPIRRLGRGGMATVWLARDHTASSDVALKILLPHLRADPIVAQRFRREVSVARRVIHPNVIRIHDLLETDELLTLVLEYHPGEDGKELLRARGELPVHLAIELVDQALQGLIAAHDAGIIHRDIKPHNLLVAFPDGEDGDPVVKLADFGLARVDDLIGMTMHTRAVGTLEYMAPEQFDSHLIDHRADLYGLGVTLYELLSGELPFRAHTPLALAELHQSAPRPNVRDLAQDVPEHVALTIQRAMASDPSARFSTASEMLAALRGEQPVVQRDEDARVCVECGASLLRRLDTCLECGHTNRKLLRQPGRGKHSVVIFSPHERVLSDVEQKSLVKLLRRDDTTSPHLKVGWNVGQVPAVLAHDLVEEDAERLATELADHELSSKVMGPGLLNRLSVARMMQPPLMNIFGVLVTGTTFCLCAPMGTLFAATEGGLQGLSLLWPVMLFIVVYTAVTLMRMRDPILRIPKPEHGDEAIESEIERTLSAGYLPDETAALIKSITGRRTREMIKKILGAALELHAQQEDHPDETGAIEQSIRHLLDRTVEQARALVALEEEVTALDAQRILERVRDLEARVAQEEETLAVGEMLEEKAKYHAQLARLDEAQREISMRTSTLLHIHAELEQLLDDLQQEERVIFDHENQVSVILAGLAEQIDATIEAEEAVEMGAFSLKES